MDPFILRKPHYPHSSSFLIGMVRSSPTRSAPPTSFGRALRLLGASMIIAAGAYAEVQDAAQCPTDDPACDMSMVLLQRGLVVEGGRAAHQTADTQRANDFSAAGFVGRSFAAGTELVSGAMHFRGRGGTCLNFLHIPKTGGSSIEEDGFRVAMTERAHSEWGMYDLDLACTYTNGSGEDRKCAIGSEDGPQCRVWHVPPALDPILAEHYAPCDTFCVVRHPGHKMFSQFAMERTWTSPSAMGCSAKAYETWALNRLEKAHSEPFVQDCHFLPQWLFVYGKEGSASTAPPMCNRVLRYENLSSEFDALMREYDIPAQLNSHALNGTCQIPDDQKITPAVNEFYAEDFATFHYSVL
jgi:hypothetical protein